MSHQILNETGGFPGEKKAQRHKQCYAIPLSTETASASDTLRMSPNFGKQKLEHRFDLSGEFPSF